MKRILRAAWLALAFLPLACTAAQDEPYKLGQHYKAVRQESSPADPSKIEVAEAFWYGCPHCYQFEPFVASWLARKPADVSFVRLPASLGRPVGVLHSKAYFAAESMGVLDRMHRPLFDAIHQQHKPMDTQDALRALFVDVGGVGPIDFDAALSGFAVDNRVRRAETALRDYGISGVPALIVGGKYQTAPHTAGGFDQAFKVVDFLVEKLRKERKPG